MKLKKITVLCLSLIFALQGFAGTTINFATEATYPPFEFMTPDGKINGFDVEIMDAICQKIEATCTVKNQPFDSLIPSLQLGKFDGIYGALNITAERAKQVDFTMPF